MRGFFHAQPLVDPNVVLLVQLADALRDSAEMKSFLGMEDEDRCLGLFIVAACDPALKDSRRRAPEAHNSVEWRD